VAHHDVPGRIRRRPGDAMEWLGDYFGPNPTATSSRPDRCVLIGARTWEVRRPMRGRCMAGRDRTAVRLSTPHRTLRRLLHLRQRATSAQWCAGSRLPLATSTVAILGPTTTKQVLDAACLTKILVHIAPVLLGDGVRLFNHLGGTTSRLEQISVTPHTEVTNLWLRVQVLGQMPTLAHLGVTNIASRSHREVRAVLKEKGVDFGTPRSTYY